MTRRGFERGGGADAPLAPAAGARRAGSSGKSSARPPSLLSLSGSVGLRSSSFSLASCCPGQRRPGRSLGGPGLVCSSRPLPAVPARTSVFGCPGPRLGPAPAPCPLELAVCVSVHVGAVSRRWACACGTQADPSPGLRFSSLLSLWQPSEASSFPAAPRSQCTSLRHRSHPVSVTSAVLSCGQCTRLCDQQPHGESHLRLPLACSACCRGRGGSAAPQPQALCPRPVLHTPGERPAALARGPASWSEPCSLRPCCRSRGQPRSPWSDDAGTCRRLL